MEQQLQVFFSNRVEELFLNFKETVFAPGSPSFARRLIIVPSPALKSWLMLKLAKDPDIGIAAGMEISYLDQSVQRLQALLFPYDSTSKLPNAMELALAIEWELKNILLNDNLHQMNGIWQPLLSYLHIEQHKPFSRKSERRLTALSEKIAHVFLEYGKYGSAAIADWESLPSQTWQQELWKRIFKRIPMDLLISYAKARSGND